MSDEEKVKKFNEIQEYLWSQAKNGNAFASSIMSQIIRNLKIVGPNGEDPESA